jgi:predicted ATPase with chaperone activity
VQTGHPGYKQLVDLHWAGKTFHSINDVDPIIVREQQPDGSVKRVANGIMGKARLREVKYNGVVSAAMIYNERPIIDYFRAVDERTIIGVMDALGSTADHGLFFLLERVEEAQGKL